MCDTTCIHKCSPVGKETAFGHSPRGPAPLSVGTLGLTAEQTRRGRPAVGTGGHGVSVVILPSSWLPAELCPARAGSCGLYQTQVSHGTRVQHGCQCLTRLPG